MISRRAFLLRSVGLAVSADLVGPQMVWAKGKKRIEAPLGPHTVYKLSWPPILSPERVTVLDRGYCCFTDEFGRLAVVDMRKILAGGASQGPPSVIAELNGGLGKKVIDLISDGRRAFVIVSNGQESLERFELLTINLTVPAAPSIVARMKLDRFAEPITLALGFDFICVAGVSTSGENLVSLYATSKADRTIDPNPISSISVLGRISNIDVQDRKLLVLITDDVSKLYCYNIINARAPEPRGSLAFKGPFNVMARIKNQVVVTGIDRGSKSASDKGECTALFIALEPELRVVSAVPLAPLQSVVSAAAGQKDQFYVFGEGKLERGMGVLTVTHNKELSLTKVVQTPSNESELGERASMSAKLKAAYIACGQGGIEVLSETKGGWQHVYTYKIPRLPASGMAQWNQWVVIGGNDLRLFDVTNVNRPVLVSTIPVNGSVKAMTGAGSFVLFLSRDGLTLKKMENLKADIATVKSAGQRMCYDSVQHQAFVLRTHEEKTAIQPYKIYSDSLAAGTAADVDGRFVSCAAHGGYLAVASVNDLKLYGTSNGIELIGARHFENLAIRDLRVTDDFVIATAVDQNSKGFFLVLSKEAEVSEEKTNEKTLHITGSIDLPTDAATLAVRKDKAIVIGKNTEGRDTMNIINISLAATPKITHSVPILDGASAVTLKDNFAMIAGRGFEILTLS